MVDISVTYDDPITVNSGPVTVTIDGLDNIKIDSSLAVTQPIVTDSKLSLSIPDPIQTDSKFALTIPEPIYTDSKAAITTDSKAEIDLQPVVLDQCLRLSLAPLPATHICLPNRQRLGLSLFGVEVFGVTLEGEAQIIVGEHHRQPHIVGREAHAAHAEHGDGPSLRIRLGA